MTDPAHNSWNTNDAESGDSPVTVWLRQLEVGDTQAAQPLYQHFCGRLQEMARMRIPASVRSAYDQDDVAVSAFHSPQFARQRFEVPLRPGRCCRQRFPQRVSGRPQAEV
ncbi:MAG: hypothetical protein GY903_19945 [Fuerstiella sp.]|nr:hypothetical protein [Fuerstiella sp.]